MAQQRRVALIVAAVAATMLRSTVFVPAPAGKPSAPAAACAAAVLGAAGNAHADAIGDAAAKLSKAAYPFMKEVPWNSGLYNLPAGSADPIGYTKAIAKMIDMGAQMDSKLLKAGAEAHASAISGLPASGVCSEAQLTAINAALGRLIASVPESTTMGVYNAVGALMDPKVPAYLMSTVKESDARAAYNALVDFTQVVKANPITPSTPASSVSGSAASSITAAADKLSSAAYPFIKDIDWTSDLYSKPIPGADPQKVTKAIGKMITMGAAMDGASLKEAANAHVKAIQGMDAKGVLSQSDFASINAGLGKAIASVPTSKVMDVYNSMAQVVGSSGVPNKLFSTVNPADAQAAYNAFLEFKDVVKAAQR
jgi:hypothetical protein